MKDKPEEYTRRPKSGGAWATAALRMPTAASTRWSTWVPSSMRPEASSCGGPLDCNLETLNRRGLIGRPEVLAGRFGMAVGQLDRWSMRAKRSREKGQIGRRSPRVSVLSRKRGAALVEGSLDRVLGARSANPRTPVLDRPPSQMHRDSFRVRVRASSRAGASRGCEH